jgi:hypothetical protein
MKSILKWLLNNWMWFALFAMLIALGHPKGQAALNSLFY